MKNAPENRCEHRGAFSICVGERSIVCDKCMMHFSERGIGCLHDTQRGAQEAEIGASGAKAVAEAIDAKIMAEE